MDKRLVWASLICAVLGIVMIWLFITVSEPKVAEVSRYNLAENYGTTVMFRGYVVAVETTERLVIIGTSTGEDGTQVLLKKQPSGIHVGNFVCASGKVSSIGSGVGLIDATVRLGPCKAEPILV